MNKTPQKQNVNIDISKTVAIKCDNPECENDMFLPAMKFRKVSKLLTGAAFNKDESYLPLLPRI